MKEPRLNQRIDLEYVDYLGRPVVNKCFVVRVNNDTIELKNIHIGCKASIILKKEIFTPAKEE